LDYWEFVDLRVHKSWDEFTSHNGAKKLLPCSKRAAQSYTSAHFEPEIISSSVRRPWIAGEMLAADEARCYRIPMMGAGVRISIYPMPSPSSSVRGCANWEKLRHAGQMR
jgi:tRNA(Leu) C34 or U34 (ribose-2'-O)-methylase TrmL